MSAVTVEQSVAGRAVYYGGLVGVLWTGLMVPLLGLAVALVLDRTVFRPTPRWGSQLVRMGLCTQLFWVGVVVVSLL